MIYGARHSDKCTDGELSKFRQEILTFLVKEGYGNLKLRALNCFGGQIKIYTGNKTNRIPRRMRRRLVAWKEPNGKICGKSEEAKVMLLKNRANELWEKTNAPIEELETFNIYRTEWYSSDTETVKDEKEQLKSFLIKQEKSNA